MGNCQAQSNSLLVNAQTWNQDTHGLYDYESNQIVKQEFQIHQNTYFMRDPENMNRLISQSTQPPMTLFQIDVVGNQRCIRVGNVMPKWGETAEMSVQHPQQKTPNKKCWLSVHSVGRVPLKRGDIFRLGRLTFRIWDMDLSSMDQNDSATSEGGVDVCRVCLRGPMPNNPLLNPCKCCGSLKYLHKECLKRWLQSKMPSKQTVNSELYIWKDLQCEICKTFYKPIFQSDGTSYHFSELAKPMSSYMILEFKSKKSEQGCGLGDHFSAKADGIYVVYLNDEVKIGRARTNEIRACDVSVSRCHATIKREGQQLYLQDNDSKYGTLLLLSEDMPILGEHNNVEFQVGRSVFKLQTRIISC